MATLLKTVKLSMETHAYEAQLNQAELVDDPTTEKVTTFFGEEESSTPNYKLNLGGFQDYGDLNGICGVIHAAYQTDPIAELDFVITVGTQTRTGVCKPTKDVPFGGDAGSPLKFSVTLDVVGTPTDGVVTP